jgi:hypothetical protein
VTKGLTKPEPLRLSQEWPPQLTGSFCLQLKFIGGSERKRAILVTPVVVKTSFYPWCLRLCSSLWGYRWRSILHAAGTNDTPRRCEGKLFCNHRMFKHVPRVSQYLSSHLLWFYQDSLLGTSAFAARGGAADGATFCTLQVLIPVQGSRYAVIACQSSPVICATIAV